MARVANINQETIYISEKEDSKNVKAFWSLLKEKSYSRTQIASTILRTGFVHVVIFGDSFLEVH